MALPIRTTLEDVDVICGYLATKPAGATLAEARAVVDSKHLDGRKLSALKLWGLVEETDNKIRITDMGRRAIRDSGAMRSEVLREVISRVGPYSAIVERVVHRNEKTLSATDIAAHWYEHFKQEASDSEKILNDQALCYFQVAQGAGLGMSLIGRRGMPTRFEFDVDAARAFVTGTNETNVDMALSPPESSSVEEIEPRVADEGNIDRTGQLSASEKGNRVFITHGKNLKILDQVKQILTFGRFDPVIAMEHGTAAKPVPQKVMDEMRTCDAAVIHVSTDRVLYDQDGAKVPSINENVLIEIGAAMALYGDRFVLLVEEGVYLPSNLQGLYECRYQGAELNVEATMKLLKAFNEF